MNLPELLALATTTLNAAPHHPAVTPKLCAAICWVESHGDGYARGDGGKALGIAQFHQATWYQFARRRCETHRGAPPYFANHATCRHCSMLALVAELRYAANRAPKDSNPDQMRRWLCRFHNAGRFDHANTVYCRKVADALQDIAALPSSSKPAPTTQPASKER